jgi:hypothetical protein
MTDRDVMKIAGAAKVQLFFCGGQGGVGAYDGKGGPMEKDGGPMDRLFFCDLKDQYSNWAEIMV